MVETTGYPDPGAADVDQRLAQRLALAKQDRDRHGSWINEIFRLGLPTYRRMGGTKSATSTVSMSEQDDLFDATLQTVLEDFSSDMLGTFTPRFDRWVTFEPSVDLTEGQRRAIGGDLRRIEDSIFDEIERSNYYQAAQECFTFWGISAMAAAISDMGPLNPIHCQPIELPDLLMERGPDGSVTGRWREMTLDDRQLAMLWPHVFPIPSRFTAPTKRKVIEGCDRDFSRPGEERWVYRILVDGKQRFARAYTGAGSCPIIACRFRHQADSAWGPGPAHKAVPMARVLDELAYLNLKGIQRSVDPITSYEEDGVQNPEGGIDPGTWMPRAAGSEPPETIMPELSFQATIWKTEDLEAKIKRAMYQDRPEQPGKTPPTLGQWTDEKAWNTRRRELPRDRCVREWVMPVIDRFMWIKSQRGELPPIRVGDRAITVRPVSPLSKAKDLDDVQVTAQVLTMAQTLGAVVQAMPAIDPRATLQNVVRTLRERHIVFLTDDQIAQAAQIALSKNTVDDAGQAGSLTTPQAANAA